MLDTHKKDYAQRTVGELVTENYARAAAFKRLGIDFCCGGGRTVLDASQAAGVPWDEVERQLSQADAGPATTDDDPRGWSLARLVEHIESVHHGYVRQTLPVLRAFTDKVARVHGTRHPELLPVRNAMHELATELETHLQAEELELFPVVVALEERSRSGAREGEATDAKRQVLEDDHDHAGALMRSIRELTSDFAVPDDACATYRATLALLEEFEGDLHRHVHLENNILFPGAAALEAELARAAAG